MTARVIKIPRTQSARVQAVLASSASFAEAAQAAPATAAAAPRWSGPIVVEGEMTGDARMIEVGALRWDTLPIPLRWAREDTGGHMGAEVVGRIETIERTASGQILATGTFDVGSEVGREAYRQVAEGLTTGVSVDLDDVAFEVRIASEVIEASEAMWEAMMEGGEPPEPETDDEGRVIVARIGKDDEVMVTTDARVRAATIVAVPAFETARLAITDHGDLALAASAAPVEADTAPAAIVASAAPVNPPAAWFAAPTLTGPTALQVTEDGRVFGHLALWETCHTGYAGQCVTPPASNSGYAYFRTGALLTAEGTEVPVGALTVDTMHAPSRASAKASLAHYDHTGTAVAWVSAGEDEWGVWVAGSLRSDASEEQVAVLRSSPLSGDWRRIGTSMELVAALAVNVPGFPVPRTRALVASGSMQSLVAAGMVAPDRVIAPGQPGALTPDDLRYLKRLAARERAAEVARTVVDEDDPRLLALRAKALTLRVKETIAR
ncbi:MAG TPA: hypothetical protein VJ788_02765 [Gemmatimonadota bacterium]|nr:hypothetical protein [Gemmatimonadota bacterium]